MQVLLSSTRADTGWNVRFLVQARQQAVKVTGRRVQASRMDSLVDDSFHFGMVQCFRLATVVSNGEDKLSKYA